MKRYRGIFKAKDGSEIRVNVLADTKDEAERFLQKAQFRREERFPLTFDRIQAAHAAGELTKEQFKAETERRERDRDRYDGAGLKLVKLEEVKP